MILNKENVTSIRTRLGEDVVINYLQNCSINTLVEEGLIDTIIVDSEDGFSHLGMMRSFLSAELGLPERNIVKFVMDGFSNELEYNISSLADWNRSNPDITLIAIPAKRDDSRLRGIIISPYEGSHSYEKYATPKYGKPYRDYFYNVTYEAIAYAKNTWGAKKIGLMHLARMRTHLDITTCQIEAICHFCDEHKGIESFTFTDIAELNKPIEIAKNYNALKDRGTHRDIHLENEMKYGCDFIRIKW